MAEEESKRTISQYPSEQTDLMNALSLAVCKSKKEEAERELERLEKDKDDLTTFQTEVTKLTSNFCEAIKKKFTEKRQLVSALVTELMEEKIQDVLKVLDAEIKAVFKENISAKF